MPTLQYLPAWTVDYSYTVQPNIIRTSSGPTSQRRISHRNRVVANAQRRLIGAELPYFEWFIRGECNDGQLQFTDYYADQNGLNSGTVRILNGTYTVSTDTRTHLVTCELEIFR